MNRPDRAPDLAAQFESAGADARSPASALVRPSLGGAFAATAAHQRRHLWQARQVRDAAGFPG